MIDQGLRDAVVLITGVNSPYGIGAATAKAFAKQGAAVIATYLPPLSDVAPSALPPTMGEVFYRAAQGLGPNSLVEQIRAEHGRIEVVAADLADADSIPMLFGFAEATFGPVSVLVNNAAHCVQDTFLPAEFLQHGATAADNFPMHPLTAQGIDQHFAVNSRAVALLIAEFARRHCNHGANWGRIVSVSSDGAAAFASEVSYGASKYALESYSRAAAKELGQFGITVNIVSLGPIQTGWITPAMEQEIARTTPLRRVGQPADVADAIVLLASEQARWITGQCIFVGGGHHIG